VNAEPGAARSSILIVEDEPIVAKDLQQSLREMGYDAYAIASSADDAIRRASERCPDLVLMDIRIKGARDGIQTAEILRRQFGVSVVYLTAHADEATIERAAKTEPYGYLLKPIKSAELRSAIEVAAYKQRFDKNVRERERGFSTALRSVQDAVVIMDLAGKVSFLNPAAEALIGAKADAAIGKTADQVLRLMDRSTLVSDTTPLLFGDGADASRGEEQHIGAVMVFRDVGEKQKMQKQLELADRLTSLGTMAAGTAHELNNPLTVVVTNAGFIGEELQQHLAELQTGAAQATTETRLRKIFEALGDLQAAASRMGRIVADLRAFSRPAEEARQTIDLRRCVEWAARATAHDFHHRAQLRTKFEPTPAVIGETARLEQVLVNLLVNAAHAIAPGNVENNEVSVTVNTAADGRAQIEVRDTGAGMAPDVLKRIFEPFFTTKETGAGTGLGLAISHGIVKSLGGEICVASEPGKGTTFTVLLSAAPAQQPAVSEAAAISAPLQRGRILVIDDEISLLRAMQRILEDDNHTAVCTDKAREALAMIASGERFDLILSDLMMPSMTGVEFYEQLLAIDPAIARSVVFVTGGAITAKVDAFLNSIPNSRLEKPFKGAQLREVVQRALVVKELVP